MVISIYIDDIVTKTASNIKNVLNVAQLSNINDSMSMRVVHDSRHTTITLTTNPDPVTKLFVQKHCGKPCGSNKAREHLSRNNSVFKQEAYAQRDHFVRTSLFCAHVLSDKQIKTIIYTTGVCGSITVVNLITKCDSSEQTMRQCTKFTSHPLVIIKHTSYSYCGRGTH